MMKTTLIASALAAALAAGCHEIPQDAPKPYAGKADVAPWSGDLFKGDKAKFEQALAQRANGQDEYLHIGDENAPRK
jgi:hypothetical protein